MLRVSKVGVVGSALAVGVPLGVIMLVIMVYLCVRQKYAKKGVGAQPANNNPTNNANPMVGGLTGCTAS